MVRKIDRKLLRDLWASKLQYGALVLLLTLGIAIFSGTYVGYLNLGRSEEKTYEELLLADAFFRVAGAPEAVVQEVAGVNGVEAVEGRTVRDVGMVDPVNPRGLLSARVISVPDSRRPVVNDLLVDLGEYLPTGLSDAVLVDRIFAEKKNLSINDELVLVLEGSRSSLAISGTFTSPEYIWKAKSLQEPLVAPDAFAVVFVRQSVAESLFNQQGTINEITVRFTPGADGETTMDQVQHVLAPYNLLESIPRDRQPSYILMKLDLEGFGEIAMMVPAMFLIITALSIFVLMTRTAHAQRNQIGLLCAVGYGQGQVMRHYLGYALLVGVLGCLLGTAIGYGLAALVTSAYTDVANIPFAVMDVHWHVLGIGVGLGLGTCVLAGLFPAWRAANLEPATAMRPLAPTGGHLTLADRVLPMKRMPFVLRLAVRSVFRQRRRSLVNMAGIAVSVSLIVAALGLMDGLSSTLDMQFGRIESYDLNVTLTRPDTEPLVEEFADWAGVERAEPILETPVRLVKDTRAYSTILIGLTPESELIQPIQDEGATPLSKPGLYLSSGIAGELDVQAGDVVEVQTPLGTNELEIAGTVQSPLSPVVYSSLSQVQKLVNIPGAITGVMLAVTPEQIDGTKEALSAMPVVMNVEELTVKRDAMVDYMALFYQFVAVFVLFGAALAFLVVFNTVSMNIMERARELATMRTLGFGTRSTTTLITLENAIGAIIGIAVGIGLGYLEAVEMMRAFESDFFKFNAVLYPRTYVAVTIGMALVVFLSQVPAVRHVNRLDLARVTKEQSG